MLSNALVLSAIVSPRYFETCTVRRPTAAGLQHNVKTALLFLKESICEPRLNRHEGCIELTSGENGSALRGISSGYKDLHPPLLYRRLQSIRGHGGCQLATWPSLEGEKGLKASDKPRNQRPTEVDVLTRSRCCGHAVVAVVGLGAKTDPVVLPYLLYAAATASPFN